MPTSISLTESNDLQEKERKEHRFRRAWPSLFDDARWALIRIAEQHPAPVINPNAYTPHSEPIRLLLSEGWIRAFQEKSSGLGSYVLDEDVVDEVVAAVAAYKEEREVNKRASRLQRVERRTSNRPSEESQSEERDSAAPVTVEWAGRDGDGNLLIRYVNHTTSPITLDSERVADLKYWFGEHEQWGNDGRASEVHLAGNKTTVRPKAHDDSKYELVLDKGDRFQLKSQSTANRADSRTTRGKWVVLVEVGVGGIKTKTPLPFTWNPDESPRLSAITDADTDAFKPPVPDTSEHPPGRTE